MKRTILIQKGRKRECVGAFMSTSTEEAVLILESKERLKEMYNEEYLKKIEKYKIIVY